MVTNKLQRKYQKWNPHESLSYKEQIDHSVPRNLGRWFWGRVGDRYINFPVLPGQWMAVETIEKPEYCTKYPRTPFAERIGFQNDRFNIPWNEVHTAIVREKENILSDIGLSRQSANIRFLEAIEYNLLANREGWGKTNTYEWTKTSNTSKYDFDTLKWTNTDPKDWRLVIVGNSDRGGAAGVSWAHPDKFGKLVGFRAAVVLSF